MEYRFRGYDAVGNKGWVYGDLVHNQKVTDTGLVQRVMVGGYEVVPESVGLFTGLEDADGKPIYQGDIIEHFSGRYKGVVLWDDRGFFYYYGTPHFRDSEIIVLGEKLKNARYYIVNSVFDNSRLIKKQKKMKIYYLTLSQQFPSYMPNAGESTGFKDAFDKHQKIHTIRANYDFWAKRFEKIAAGEACLSIRQWVGKPYGKGSTQREIARLTREDGIGIQKLTFAGINAWYPSFVDVDGYTVDVYDLARNDGLAHADWCNWFAGYDLTEPLAIIHFTDFRY